MLCEATREQTSTCISSHENKLAHVLAQYVKGVANFVTWIDENPSTIFTGSRYIEFIFFLIKATYFLSKKKKKKMLINFFGAVQIWTLNLLLDYKKFYHLNLKYYHKIQDVMKAWGKLNLGTAFFSS